MDNIFNDEIFEGVESLEKKAEEKKEVIAELPEAYMVMTTDSNGKQHIVDTFYVDKVRGIMPIDKARKKAKLMKNVYPNKTYFVVEVLHRTTNVY